MDRKSAAQQLEESIAAKDAALAKKAKTAGLDAEHKELSLDYFASRPMATAVDKAVGDFVAMLKDDKYGNMWEDTVVVAGTQVSG